MEVVLFIIFIGRPKAAGVAFFVFTAHLLHKLRIFGVFIENYRFSVFLPPQTPRLAPQTPQTPADPADPQTPMLGPQKTAKTHAPPRE